MSYLAGNAKKVGEDGLILYDRKKVFLHTVFFVIGISFAFFILGMSFTVLGNFFNQNKIFFIRVSGILIVILGLFQLGVLDFSFLQKERKLHLNLADKKINPFLALVLGFTFSFAWTPCIGPALSSVLIMASGAKTAVTGYMLVFIYALGFVLPFLLLGLFTTQALDFLKSKQKLLKYTIKAGGIILIIMGIMTFTGWMNGVSSYLNSISYTQQSGSQTETDVKGDGEEAGKPDSSAENQNSDSNQSGTDTGVTGNVNGDNISEETTDGTSNDTAEDTTTDTSDTTIEGTKEKNVPIPAFDFTLTDQYGEEHTLSDYKGKVVFLNFWATWCPPCKEEMPHIEELYNEYNLNQEDVVFLGVTNPKSEKYPYNQDEKKEDIISFLDKNEYTFPTVFDETGEILQNYSITAFPTTFMIDKEGNVFGYVPGKMTKDIMKNVIDQTLQGTK
jgi:cytochrome c-type biogenesis protein